MSLSLSGPGSVFFVQRRCLCGRKLSLLSPHLPDTAFSPYIYKQQLIGICWILAAGARCYTGELVWTHQYTPTLSSRSVIELGLGRGFFFLNMSNWIRLHACNKVSLTLPIKSKWTMFLFHTLIHTIYCNLLPQLYIQKQSIHIHTYKSQQYCMDQTVTKLYSNSKIN